MNTETFYSINPVQTFMNELPKKLRPTATEIYGNFSFSELYEMRVQENPFVQPLKAELNDAEWQQTLDAIILTKATEFEFMKTTPVYVIDGLLEALADVLGIDVMNLTPDFYLLKPHREFREWLEKLISFKNQAA